MQHIITLDEQLVRSAQPRGTMLSVCPVPGCTTLTMGGTCVAHDPPVTVTFERGRPYVAENADEFEPLGLAG